MSPARLSSARVLALSVVLAAVGVIGLQTEPAHGQSDEGPPVWQFGARAEVISSAATDNLAGQTESSRGLGVAAQVRRRIGGPVSARLELAYLPRGVRQELRDRSADVRGRTVTADTRLHYLSLPMFIQAGLEAGSSPVTLDALRNVATGVSVGVQW